MRVRTMQINGKTWMLEDDVRKALAPFSETLRVLFASIGEPTGAGPVADQAAPAKRRTKAEIEEAIRASGATGPSKELAAKLGMRVSTLARHFVDATAKVG
jgi:hypothetical protein